MASTFVHDRGLARRLPALVRSCGFEIARFRGHSFVKTNEAVYMLTILDRVIDTLHASGRFGEDMVAGASPSAVH